MDKLIRMGTFTSMEKIKEIKLGLRKSSHRII
jgi:hypothetical protein